jgi:hypothetical protein
MARFKFCKGTLLDSHALPCATGARQKTLPCGFCPGAHQRAHDAFLLGKDLCLAPLGKTTHDVGLCRAQNVTHNKEKGSTAVPQRDGVTRSLPCATQILMAQKKEKKSKTGRGPPPPGHDHAAAGHRSSVPHASEATTTTRWPHCSVRRYLTSAALSGAWAVTRVGRESRHRGQISGLSLRGREEEGGSRRATAGVGAAAAGSKREPRPPRPGKKEARGEEASRCAAGSVARRRPATAVAPWGGGGRAAALWGRTSEASPHQR